LPIPVIVAYVGGIPDMVGHQETGLLYRLEEIEMLAKQISKIFTENSFAIKISNERISKASIRHNREVNLEKMEEIYYAI